MGETGVCARRGRYGGYVLLMDLYARVNILGGHSVRLPRGELADAIRLDNDPISRARNWAEQGVDAIHVVDLDAAAHRDYRNRELIDRLVSACELPVQVAGGVRSPAEAARLIEAGAWRVVMGTAAIEDQNMVWELCRDHPDKIVVSIDVRPNEEIATRGWTMNSGRFLEEVLVEMSSAGVAAFLIAEAGRDALLEPPNLDILATALATVEQPVIASGGVRHLDDLRDVIAVHESGRQVGGVIVGREVTHGRFTIEEAKAVLAEAPRSAPAEVSATPRAKREAPHPAIAAAADKYYLLAAELERAAAHARTSAQRLLAGETPRGHAHGLATVGHMRKAQRLMDELSVELAETSTT